MHTLSLIKNFGVYLEYLLFFTLPLLHSGFKWFVFGNRGMTGISPSELPVLIAVVHHFCTSPTVRYTYVMIPVLCEVISIIIP